MSGSLILEAMSFIDEALVEEGERELPERRPVRRWLALAACACAVIVCAWAFRENEGMESQLPVAEDPAEATCLEATETVESVVEEIPVEISGVEDSDKMESVTEQSASGYCVTIRIEERTDSAVIGVVTSVSGLEGCEVGDRVQVDLGSDFKAEIADLSRIEPVMSYTEVDGIQYLIIQVDEKDNSESYVELLP